MAVIDDSPPNAAGDSTEFFPADGFGEAVLDAYDPTDRPRLGGYWRIKRPLGFALALLATILLAPLILGIALVLSYRGRPILIRRRRLGRYGQVFNSYSFRTMVPDSLKAFGQGGERREATDAFGRLLLRTRLDRAPMIWNVLKGDMNLVGPRSLSPEEFFGSGRAAWRTMSVRPGLTGLWWLDSASGLRRRLATDRSYIEHASPAIDIRILLQTLIMIHRGSISPPVETMVTAS